MAQIKSSVKNSIVKTIRYLQNQITVTEVILFGSYAAGTQHKHSDIDIAVISPDFENKDITFRAAISSKAKLNGSIDVEIHPFTLKNLNLHQNLTVSWFNKYILSIKTFLDIHYLQQ